jgi:hypothetical protein
MVSVKWRGRVRPGTARPGVARPGKAGRGKGSNGADSTASPISIGLAMVSRSVSSELSESAERGALQRNYQWNAFR